MLDRNRQRVRHLIMLITLSAGCRGTGPPPEFDAKSRDIIEPPRRPACRRIDWPSSRHPGRLVWHRGQFVRFQPEPPASASGYDEAGRLVWTRPGLQLDAVWREGTALMGLQIGSTLRVGELTSQGAFVDVRSYDWPKAAWKLAFPGLQHVVVGGGFRWIYLSQYGVLRLSQRAVRFIAIERAASVSAPVSSGIGGPCMA